MVKAFWWVAVWSPILFPLVCLLNIWEGDSAAVGQAILWGPKDL